MTDNHLIEFWNTFNSKDFLKDTIQARFECHEECLYRIFCMVKAGTEEKVIGKWCKHYTDKFVESLNTENQDEKDN